MCDEIQCGTASDKPLPVVTETDRRNFMKGAAALPLASVLAWPELAAAAALNSTEMHQGSVNGVDFSGALAKPASGTGPAIVLIHEWWGLNDQIKSVAAELASLGYVAYAIDLYDGNVATTREDALKYVKAVDGAKATKQLIAAIDWLRGMGNGKVATMGWCFGGAWSLNASLATNVDSTIIYYGRVTKTPEQLASLNSPVLGHFGTLDKSINKEMVDGFEQSLMAAGKPKADINWYEADHAFANPTGGRYDEADAALSWERTLAFLKKTIG